MTFFILKQTTITQPPERVQFSESRAESTDVTSSKPLLHFGGTERKMEEYAREPCPWRIVDDCGGAFTMGAIGGGIFQAVKGFRNSPAGMSHRLRGSVTAIRTRAPQLGVFVIEVVGWGGGEVF
ncbi:hypothetical protein JZ751_010219 [Albula glossodonta]|uniref:Uncharacterized protein n=1 Tax=Albula glossodonta TaxID=121402 RepID=A0A8T2N1M2_9TELE|nr:hypothetical protein JZ751_010219 [Albula glossodonta]